MAGYTASYESSEISEPIIDLIITVMAAFVGFGSLVAIVLLYIWLKKKNVRVG